MKAVILAGGRGTRLRAVTHGAIPKPMAELGGRPVLENIVRHLAACGFTELCCALAYRPEVIREHFGIINPLNVHDLVKLRNIGCTRKNLVFDAIGVVIATLPVNACTQQL